MLPKVIGMLSLTKTEQVARNVSGPNEQWRLWSRGPLRVQIVVTKWANKHWSIPS